jgi:hypothetical protein
MEKEKVDRPNMRDLPCLTHGESIAVLKNIATGNVTAISAARDAIASLDKRQEVMAATMDATNKHSEERHVEIMARLDEVRDLVKATNGDVTDLQQWRGVHVEWTSNKEREFGLLKTELHAIHEGQDKARILDASDTGKRKAAWKFAGWMWAAVLFIAMPIVIIILGLVVDVIKVKLGWR